MTARQLLLALVLVGALSALGWWTLVRDDGRWQVRASVHSFQEAEERCGDLRGIDEDETLWSTTSHVAPGSMADGVYWTVEGRGNADAVAGCLRDLGAADIVIEEASTDPPKSFEPTGP